MREIGMLFSEPMVQAILDGRKTQTRRIIKPKPKPLSEILPGRIPDVAAVMEKFDRGRGVINVGKQILIPHCPYGQKGDRIWVRETWAVAHYYCENTGDTWSEYLYRATAKDDNEKWRPSIHMPRFASRITLEIVSVRVERLREITADDCYSEGIFVEPPAGCDPKKPDGWDGWSDARKNEYAYGQARATYIAQLHHCDLYVNAYRKLWESIYGPASWDENPWVWVIEFKRI